MKVLIIVASLFAVFQTIGGVKKMIHPAVTICKRNDPNLVDCYCKNFVKLLPIMRKGLPEMNLIPIDPAIIESIRLDFPQSKSVKLVADMTNVELTGVSVMDLKVCDLKVVDTGLDMYFELSLPLIKMQSKYKANGKFLLLQIDTTGDFTGEFKDIYVKANWNTTKYMKKGKEHLDFVNHIDDMTIKDMKVHFENLFGNQTELNDNVNLSINENIDVLYDEIKPIILKTLKTLSLDLINNFYRAFPFDVLFPKD